MSIIEEEGPDCRPGCLHPRMRQGPIYGAEAAEAAFKEALTAGRLHHAWMITGQPGSGKATLAYRMAAFMLAGGGPGEDSGSLFDIPSSQKIPSPQKLEIDPDHPALRLIRSRAHPGLKVLSRRPRKDGKGYYNVIRVDEVRELAPFFGLTAEGWRIVIIDALDDMNVAAQNALLKMLEEPPQNSLFLLVCHTPSATLPTIRSRCRRLALKPLKDAELAAIISETLPSLTDEERDIAVSLAEGSPGQGLSLAAGGGIALLREWFAIVAGGNLDLENAVKLAERLGQKRNEEEYFLFRDILLWWLRRRIRQTAGVAVSLLPGEQAPSSVGLEDWLNLWEKTERLLRRTEEVNLNRRRSLTTVFSAIGGMGSAAV